MTKAKQHGCTAKVHGIYGAYPCLRSGTIECDGKWYCWQHDPERVQADKEKRLAKWKAEQDSRDARNARRAAMSRVCAGVATEHLRKLEVGAVSHLLDSEIHDEMLEVAR